MTILIAAGVLLLMTLAGLAPASVVSRNDWRLLATAPLLGFALVAAVMTAVSPVMTMHTAAFVIALPIAAASTAIGLLVLWRTGVRPRDAIAWIPAALMAAGALMALIPALVRGSGGPIALRVYDSLGYLATDKWLLTHTSGARPGTDLLEQAGGFYAAGNQRIGVSAFNDAAATLLGTSPESTQLPLLAVLFGAIATMCWLLACRLGAGTLGAVVAGLWGLSPALFLLVADTTLGNLSGIALAATLVIIALAGVGREQAWAIPGGAIALAGLIACYPELLPPTLLLLALGWLTYAVRALLRRRRAAVGGVVRTTIGVAAAVLIAMALTPEGASRAVGYLQEIASASLYSPIAGANTVFDGLPPRWLDPGDGGAWLFGFVHLYQLSRWDLMSAPIHALLILLPIAMFAVILWGVWRRGLAPSVVVIGALAISAVLAYSAYGRYAHGACEYCAWKALTFALPFTAAGIGFGFGRAFRSVARSPRWVWRSVTVATVGVIVAGLALVTAADAKLVRGLINTPSALDGDLAAAASDAALRPPVLLEGLEGLGNPFYGVAVAYFVAPRSDDGGPVIITPTEGYPYLTPPNPAPTEFFSRRYRTVLTAFPGLVTNRARLATNRGFAVERPGPTDAFLAGPAASVDRTQGSAAIPWLTGDASVWVRRPAGTASRVALTTVGEGATVRVTSTVPGAAVSRSTTRAGSRLCISLPAGAPVVQLTVSPISGAPIERTGPATEADPVPAPPHAVGISRLAAGPGACPAAAAGDSVAVTGFGAGWSGQEASAPGGLPFRWMTARAGTLLVGDEGSAHRAGRLLLQLGSFARDRAVTFRINGAVVAQAVAPANAWRAVHLLVPESTSQTRISVQAHPGPQKISPSGTGDTRSVSIRVGMAQVLG